MSLKHEKHNFQILAFAVWCQAIWIGVEEGLLHFEQITFVFYGRFSLLVYNEPKKVAVRLK